MAKSCKKMEHEKLINEFEKLPIHAQKQVFDFIDFLHERYKKPENKGQFQGKKLCDDPFVGMWKERKDMADSRSWVRNTRKREFETPKD